MALPPGPNYLVRRAHYVAAPPAFVYALSRVISTFYNVATPVWLLILASVLAYPIAFTISVQYTRYVDEREAAKYGAVLPPRIPDNSIGGTKTLGRQLSQFKKGYIGEVMDQTCGELGNTINMRVFFENRVCLILFTHSLYMASHRDTELFAIRYSPPNLSTSR